jgi:transposase
MSTRCYDTDLNDAAWAWIAPYLPAAGRVGGHARPTCAPSFNAIFYLLRTGCQWRLLPCEFPRPGTVYHYFRALPPSPGCRREQVAFAPIETTGASTLGGLDRLTVQDDHRRAGQAAAAGAPAHEAPVAVRPRRPHLSNNPASRGSGR